MLEQRSALVHCLNPYFIGLPILIDLQKGLEQLAKLGLNPYFIGLPILISSLNSSWIIFPIVSILILLDYLFLSMQ